MGDVVVNVGHRCIMAANHGCGDSAAAAGAGGEDRSRTATMKTSPACVAPSVTTPERFDVEMFVCLSAQHGQGAASPAARKTRPPPLSSTHSSASIYSGPEPAVFTLSGTA
jgi:hypothetical protein